MKKIFDICMNRKCFQKFPTRCVYVHTRRRRKKKQKKKTGNEIELNSPFQLNRWQRLKTIFRQLNSNFHVSRYIAAVRMYQSRVLLSITVSCICVFVVFHLFFGYSCFVLFLFTFLHWYRTKTFIQISFTRKSQTFHSNRKINFTKSMRFCVFFFSILLNKIEN